MASGYTISGTGGGVSVNNIEVTAGTGVTVEKTTGTGNSTVYQVSAKDVTVTAGDDSIVVSETKTDNGINYAISYNGLNSNFTGTKTSAGYVKLADINVTSGHRYNAVILSNGGSSDAGIDDFSINSIYIKNGIADGSGAVNVANVLGANNVVALQLARVSDSHYKLYLQLRQANIGGGITFLTESKETGVTVKHQNNGNVSSSISGSIVPVTVQQICNAATVAAGTGVTVAETAATETSPAVFTVSATSTAAAATTISAGTGVTVDTTTNADGGTNYQVSADAASISLTGGNGVQVTDVSGTGANNVHAFNIESTVDVTATSPITVTTSDDKKFNIGFDYTGVVTSEQYNELQTTVQTMQSTIEDLQTRLANLENNGSSTTNPS